MLKDAAEAWRCGALAALAGLLSLAAIEDMPGEAHENGSDIRASAIAFVCGFALFMFVAAGIDRWSG